MQLVIGTKRWSTWSMRPWLVMRRAGIEFQEVLISLRQAEGRTTADILPYSSSGLVPALRDGDLVVWDSLAICEYLAERFPQAGLWPEGAVARAQARSACAEMHAGFAALRQEAPMALDAPPRRAELSDAARANIRRIVALWRELLQRSGGPFLGGRWSIADAYYTPVATRFRTYEVDLASHGDADGLAQAYADRLLSTPEFLAWERDALEGR